ncbi:MAG: nicotinate-nucleotide adenylyltransferase [Actinomycetota bacterium]|nr:nicotinate-nucleotide adenylyltransferase [Actinomycetota bacterium]
MTPNPDGPRRIGLLGGTFDPPHLGHLVIAEVARVELDLDQVQFVVAGQPWMKQRCSPSEDRVRMVELAVADDPAFHVNRSEIDRGCLTYTVDTLQELQAAISGAELFFLVGEDAAANMPEWREVDKALELARFVMLTRPGYDVELDGPILGRLERLTTPEIGISSTDLRARFRQGRAVRHQLPDAVIDHIRAHSLYREDEG